MHTTKLTRVGNSTGITLPREVLTAASLDRGDEVTLQVRDGKIEITKTDDGYNRAMGIGRAFNARYRRTMAALSR
jgi:antitoxin component of MazEF toxin-antitoxin module